MRYLATNFFWLIISFFLAGNTFAQVVNQPVSGDTTKEFEIIRGPSMRMIQTDSGDIQTIARGAVVQQAGTKFYADSIALNGDTRNMEAFGNVHINDGDTVNIYSQYLRYNGNEKTAYLTKDVKLTGKNGTLFTQELDYNLHTGIGNYYKNGKVINNENVITSQNGTYYADTKDVYFKKNVKMDGPKDHIRSDSLIYNMNNGMITFISETFIKNAEVEIRTSEGRYDTKNGDAFFSSRTNVKDSSGRIYTANNMALEGKSGNAQLEGDAVIIDSANGFITIANQIFLNKKNNSFLATRKPVLIIKQKNDSTYIAADTIFSGLAKMVNMQMIYPTDTATKLNQQQTEKIIDFQTDSSQNFLPLKDSATADTTLQFSAGSLQPEMRTDSTQNHEEISPAKDSANKIVDTIPPKIETQVALPASPKVKDTIPVAQPNKKTIPTRQVAVSLDSAKARDSILADKLFLEKDSTQTSDLNDSLHMRSHNDSLRNSIQPDSTSKTPDSTRYFIAYHHVRIFNDSLQSVCDSLFISSKDSVFRLYYDPVLWNGKTQVSGDTMFLFTKNKEADRLYVFDRALVINQTKEGFFNQMGGKELNAYFKNNKFDYIRVKGSQSESIYYLQNEDSAYIGMNRASADVIDMLFKDGELQTIRFINQIPGKMYPMGEIPEDQRELKGFEWLDKRRPKNKAELFQ